jgi:DNA-binding CsgD family transcriptional regulator
MAGLALVSAECARGAYTQALLRIEELRGQRRVRPGTLFAAVLAFHHACTLAVLGRLDDAYVVVVEGITAARQERDVLLLTAWTQFGGMLRLAAGELADARAEAAWSAPRDEELVPDTFTGVTRMAALCHVGSHAGDTASLRAGRAAARRVGADSSPAVRQLATRLLAGTASGPGAAAEGARLLADDPLVPAAPLVPCDYGYQPRVARIARKAGVPDLAERAAAATESVDRQNPGVPLFAGLAAQTRGIVADDPALLVDAAHLLQGTQRPLVAAGAAEDAGRVLGERKDAAAAIVHLQSAFDTYLALGAHADARRVARMLRRQGVDRQVHTARPASGWASLTPSELQVVRLIARGSTNRSAAEQLYLSPHTVSSHLRSAFSKLGIRSRVQLARFLQEVEP